MAQHDNLDATLLPPYANMVCHLVTDEYRLGMPVLEGGASEFGCALRDDGDIAARLAESGLEVLRASSSGSKGRECVHDRRRCLWSRWMSHLCPAFLPK